MTDHSPTRPNPSAASPESRGAEYFLRKEDLQRLLDRVRDSGYQVIGPTLDQEAIVYAPLESVEALPQGWTDIQEAATYRIGQRDDDAWFGYNVGPRSWKHFLFPPQLTLSTADRSAEGKWTFDETVEAAPRLAFLGVRACELAAIQVQDRVFLEGPYIDPDYQRRRSAILIIAVNCTQAAPTCFCTSMDTGPECRHGFDLALTELSDGFVIATGSEAGQQILRHLSVHDSTDEQTTRAREARQNAVEQISRTLQTDGIRDLLLNNLEHSRWDDVAERCLSCTNCTMVCPTCFCSTVSEVNDLSGDHVERQRHWDSCFNISFSYLNGGVLRNSIRNRYRQWLTHKLASWIDQFDTSGCVGCGRCITWCPVGIDLTEEVAAIRESQVK